MQFLYTLTLLSLSVSGAFAFPGYYPTSTPVTCSTSTYYSTYCPTPVVSPTPIPTVNQQNICKSGSPFCCALSPSNHVDDGGHSCTDMSNSTINCDSTVICCNNNGSGTQICTNDVTIVIPIDLSDILGSL